MTALLFYPLLGGTRHSSGTPQWLEEYGERSAVESVVAILRTRQSLSAAERPIADFLLASDLAELGSSNLASRTLSALVDSPELGADAFLALARVDDEAREDEGLRAAAREAPWRRLDDEALGEAATRVARACMRSGHYAEAREWLRHVPEKSTSYTASRLLLVQIEYALGRPAAALEAADRALERPARTSSDRWLDDRMAILVGDLLTEIGLYQDAIDVLGWPAATSPFRSRANRDRELARAMEAVAEGTSRVAPRADDDRAELERAIALASASPDALSQRVAELRRSWPSTALRAERRRSTRAAAARAFERMRPFGWRRALTVVWRSLPPVALYELARRRPSERPIEDSPTVGAEARFFFAPRPEVSRLLVALALVSEEAPASDTCSRRAANAVGARIAGSVARPGPAVTLEELATLARGCEAPDAGSIRAALESELRRAVAAESSRRILEIREQRRELAEAVAGAEVERAAMLRAAGDAR